MMAANFGQIMKRKLSALSARYLGALRKHLNQRPGASLEPARGLGRQAVAIGLETLDLARIHRGALAMLETSSSQDGIIDRADLFFTETIKPIEETHRAARNASARLKRLHTTLRQRTAELATSNRSLKMGTARRKAAQAAAEKSREHYSKLLEESLALQKHLKRLAHRILSAQEDERKRISHDLRDEIAQTVLGIDVRLLTVKKAAGHYAKPLQEEIAKTQRLVDMSVKTIERFSREYGQYHKP